MYLLKGFLDYGFLPEVIRKGRHILLLEIKQLGLRFLTSSSYLEGDEYEMAQQFNCYFEKHFFPFKFLSQQNFNYIGTIPNLNFFLSDFDSHHEDFEKKEFYKNCHSNQSWNFNDELLTHFNQTLYLLCMSFLKFIFECFEFQLVANCCEILNPISQPLSSLSGFAYKLFKIMYLNDEDIYLCCKK